MANTPTEARLLPRLGTAEAAPQAVPAVSLLTSVLSFLPGLVMALGDDSRVLAATADAQRFLGIDLATAPARLDEYIFAEDMQPFAEALTRLRGDHAQRTTLRLSLRRNDGATRLLEGSMARADGALGDGVTMWTAIDVTPCQMATEQYRQVLEGLSQGIIIHRGARPLYCNSALAHLIGLKHRDAAMAQPSIIPFVHPEDLPQVMENIQARLMGRPAPTDYQFRLISVDGNEVWVDCRSSVVNWEGEPAVLACCFDITDRKAEQTAQRQSEELFSRVFETSPDFIALTRLNDGVYVNVNKSFLDLFGFKRQEVIGHSATELGVGVDPSDRDRIVEALRNKRSVQGIELKGRSKSGEMRDIQISADIIAFDNDPLLLVIGRDIADRKRQDAELMASKESADVANRAKSEFLANMSHELRTPLNAILGFSEIIRNQIHGRIEDQKYVEYANDIHASGTHLLDIINDILDLSKVEAGRLEVHEAALALSDVLANCLRLVGPRAREAGLELKSNLPETLPPLIADERLMKQIFLNLLSNAVKFTPRGGEIRVSARLDEDGGYEISVADTGIGMDKNGIAKAKMPFGQVDSSLNRKHEGTGLGLPLVLAFVERQGGTLAIDSAPGQGTTVTIRFPADKIAAA